MKGAHPPVIRSPRTSAHIHSRPPHITPAKAPVAPFPPLQSIVPKFGCLRRLVAGQAAGGGFWLHCSWQTWMRWSMNLS